MEMVSSKQPTPLTHAVSGALGSALALLLLYPLERVRTELQASAISSSPTIPPQKISRREYKAAEESKQCHISLDKGLLNEEFCSDKSISPTSSNESSSWVTCNTVADETGDKVTSFLKLIKGIGKNKERGKSSSNESNESIFECLIRLQSEGQLYRGMGPVVYTLAASNFVFFYAHQFMKTVLYLDQKGTKFNSQISRSLLASSLAGVINVVLTNPLWVANLRIVQGKTISGDSNEKTVTLWRELQAIFKNEGMKSLWKGTMTSLLLVSNPVIQFFFYGQLKQYILLRNRRRRRNKSVISLSPLEAFVIGAFAKAISTILTYPLQLTQVLLRLQTNSDEKQQDHRDRKSVV